MKLERERRRIYDAEYRETWEPEEREKRCREKTSNAILTGYSYHILLPANITCVVPLQDTIRIQPI